MRNNTTPAPDTHDNTTQDPSLNEPGMDATVTDSNAAGSTAGYEEKVNAT